MAEIKLQTKINSFIEVQKSLQEIEKQLNILNKSVSSKAESEVSDKDGKSGDIKTTRNVDGSYAFEIRTESGWKTPVLGESSIKFKDKPASISKPILLSIDEMEAEDTTKGDVKAKKNIFDEKADKFILPRPDYESGWTGETTANTQFTITHNLNLTKLPSIIRVYVSDSANPTIGTDKIAIGETGYHDSGVAWSLEDANTIRFYPEGHLAEFQGAADYIVTGWVKVLIWK